jgi:ParB/RepB/Spo0J family partition protein
MSMSRTFVESLRKQRISEYRQGDKAQRLVAHLMAQCRRGNRCNLLECPVCDRRRNRILPQLSRAAAVKSVIGGIGLNIDPSGVEIGRNRRPLNEAKVRFIAASMYEIGQQVPIIVRPVGKKRVRLVSGWHRLAAAKRLGWDTILALQMTGDKTDARLVEITENLHRAELTVLQRSELVDEWRKLILTKVGQVAPPGGRQPRSAGINRTAKVLGLKREEVRRAKAIAGISSKAKAAAITGKLDNSQRALLEIAKQPTPSAQLKVIEEIIERKRAERARHASAAEQQAASEIAAIKAGLAKDKRTRESAKANIAYKRQRLQELKHAPAAGYGDMGITITNPSTAASQDQDESATDPSLDVETLVEQQNAEVEDFQRRIRQLEEELAASRQTALSPLVDAASPATDVGDLAIPPFLERRALSDDEQRQFDYLERVWANTSPLVRQRFLAKYAGGSVSAMQPPSDPVSG